MTPKHQGLLRLRRGPPRPRCTSMGAHYHPIDVHLSLKVYVYGIKSVRLWDLTDPIDVHLRGGDETVPYSGRPVCHFCTPRRAAEPEAASDPPTPRRAPRGAPRATSEALHASTLSHPLPYVRAREELLSLKALVVVYIYKQQTTLLLYRTVYRIRPIPERESYKTSANTTKSMRHHTEIYAAST